MEQTPLAAVVVVGWNSKKDLDACFSALLAQDYANFQIVFVDNASSDGSAGYAKENFPGITTLAQSTNLYFTGGNNVGMRYAIHDLKAEYVCLINPDTTCSTNWLSAQIELLNSSSKIGLVGCQTLFAKGFGTSDLKSTDQQSVINTAGIVPGGFLLPYDRGFGELDQGQYDTPQEVYAASGVSMVIRTSALEKAGLFFEPMEMYLEDIELCLRIKRAGYMIWYTPKATVWHKHMQSTAKQQGDFYLFYARSNYLVLVARHYSLKKLWRALYQNFRDLMLGQFLRTTARFCRIMLQSWTS